MKHTINQEQLNNEDLFKKFLKGKNIKIGGLIGTDSGYMVMSNICFDNIDITSFINKLKFYFKNNTSPIVRYEFKHCEFVNIDFKDKDLANLNFMFCDLSKVDFKNAKLKNSSFVECGLDRSRLVELIITNGLLSENPEFVKKILGT